MYDAKELLELVKDKWTLEEPNVTKTHYRFVKRRYLENGDFETGDMSEWDYQNATVQSVEKHGGSYACRIEEGGYIIQDLYHELRKSEIEEFYLWFKRSVTITLRFTDNTSKSVTTGDMVDWTHIDLLTFDLNPCIGDPLFPDDKTIFSIMIHYAGQVAWVDDIYISNEVELPVAEAVKGELFLALDEFNPKAPLYQIVFINKGASTIHVSPLVTKHEQLVEVDVHVKLVRYDPDTIIKSRETFKAIKDELIRIFTEHRYNGLEAVLNTGSWVDEELPHGYGEDKEPLKFVSRLTVEISQYKSVDDSLIGVRVSRLGILGNNILGLIECSWEDSVPWVDIQIPSGPRIEQHLLGPTVNGEFITHDFNSLHNALFTTEITENPNHYPINIDNSKSLFATNPSKQDFIIELMDHKGGIYKFQFVNVIIKQLQLARGTTSGKEELLWRVLWSADYYYPIV